MDSSITSTSRVIPETEEWLRVSCVSLGPGDPELITLKAWKNLKEADVVFCPGTISDGKLVSRSHDILLALDIDTSKVRCFEVPMSRDHSLAQAVYRDVAKEIISQVECGHKVSFVAEGDSGFYSSVQYIADYLSDHGLGVAHIAGVPAFIACGAHAGIHIVKQDEPLLVIPAGGTTEEIRNALDKGMTIVMMKLPRQAEVVKALARSLNGESFYYFENIGIQGKEYHTTDIDEIIQMDFPYFSMLIIRRM